VAGHGERAATSTRRRRAGRRSWKPPQVAAHYAVSALFEDYPNPAADLLLFGRAQKTATPSARGRARLSIGRGPPSPPVLTDETGSPSPTASSISEITTSTRGVIDDGDSEAYQNLITEAGAAFEAWRSAAGGAAPRRLLRWHALLPALRSSVNEQRRHPAAHSGRQRGRGRRLSSATSYARHAPLMRFLKTLGTPAAERPSPPPPSWC